MLGLGHNRAETQRLGSLDHRVKLACPTSSAALDVPEDREKLGRGDEDHRHGAPRGLATLHVPAREVRWGGKSRRRQGLEEGGEVVGSKGGSPLAADKSTGERVYMRKSS